ncbi:grasp-with-spasm system ATP-grasp peptide maturase [Flavobacterium sp. UW10123]|uniref:grasp-with-spasm system ATP-grasp peptide maturase n=1 Tax=Flavobacterium sp. UW10123 TaxID=3230800 RepID=UPI00339ABFB6
MILILSRPNDYDTHLVIEWLHHYKTPFFRLNDEELMSGETSIKYYNGDVILKNQIEINLNQIKVVWFRKFGFLSDLEDQLGKNSDLMNYISKEFKSLSTYLIDKLADKTWLFDKKLNVSKIEMLDKAKMANIKFPDTLICSKKSDLKDFFIKNNKSLITKSIGDGNYIKHEDDCFKFQTHKIESIDHFEDQFSPSFFQAYIEKEIEIRTFYLGGCCYSMAIFSQQNEKTKLDFRNYDLEKPNRYVPYKLPDALESNIKKFMDSINLNTGSLDILKSSADSEYYFLEVNPCGQFGMTSDPCNYNLHEKVAQFLKTAIYEN